MKFKKSVSLGISLVSALFFAPMSAQAEAVYRANSDKSESVSIPLPDEKVQKALLKNSDRGYYGDLTQEECDLIVDHLVHILTTYDGDIFNEYAYKDGYVYYSYYSTLVYILSNNHIITNQKLINAAFEYASRSTKNYSLLLDNVHARFITILDEQTTGKSSLEHTQKFISLIIDTDWSVSDQYAVEWYVEHTPHEQEIIRIINKMTNMLNLGAFYVRGALKVVKTAKKRFPTVDLTHIKQAFTECSTLDLYLIDDIITEFPDLKQTFILKLSNNNCWQNWWIPSKQKNRSFFKDIILQRYLHGEKINSTDSSSLELPLMKALYRLQADIKTKELLPDYYESNQGQTKKYIDQSAQQIHNDFDLDEAPAIYQLSKELIALEDQEARRGHYTFANGGPKQLYPIQYWFTKLFEIKNNVDLGEYLFTRFESDHSLLKRAYNGLTRPINQYIGSRANVFMQYALFKGWWGCNPASFYTDSRQIIHYKNSIKNIFAQLGYQEIYTQFQQELTDLESEYLSLCPHGQLLLFSFSREALKKCVYPCYDGGRARSVRIVDEQGQEIETRDVALIIDAFNNSSESVKDITTKHGRCYSEIQFCFIPSVDYGLHPDIAGKDVRIFSLNGADPEKMKSYKEKEQALLEKIKTAITETYIA